MTLAFLILGLVLLTFVDALRVMIGGDGWSELFRRKNIELLCRGADMWLVGWGTLSCVEGAASLEIRAIALGLGAAVVLLFVCLVARAARASVYEKSDEMLAQLHVLKEPRWLLATVAEYFCGLSAWGAVLLLAGRDR